MLWVVFPFYAIHVAYQDMLDAFKSRDAVKGKEKQKEKVAEKKQ